MTPPNESELCNCNHGAMSGGSYLAQYLKTHATAEVLGSPGGKEEVVGSLGLMGPTRAQRAAFDQLTIW